MALTGVGRKALMEHGRQSVVAGRARVSEAFVSYVVNGERRPRTRDGWKTYRRVQAAIARELNLEVTEAFTAYERGELLEAMSA